MSTLKVNTLTDTAATKSVPIADVVNGTARAWVNFNGTGTVAIRAQYNVSHITDNGTGDYTVNFTTAMPNANYVGQVTAGDGSAGAGSYNRYGNCGAYATGSFGVFTGFPGTSIAGDMVFINVSIFR